MAQDARLFIVLLTGAGLWASPFTTHVSEFAVLVGWISLRIHRHPIHGEEWYMDVPFTDLRMACADAYPPYEFSDSGFVK